ncbi:helix-turn-helix domain-containing protein [Methyloversatilis sp.]|uniref:helix-turn-helix domain-containing protein n=1 Tax=Methyloversatilis sp. TaxID=2569862 RepID=UPI0027368511|nr:helix-turn-helix domain-containing protein [Methyloversatilis sp.]
MRKTLIVSEVSTFLRLHKVTVSEMARKGRLPAAKVGGKWIFFLDEIEQFVQESATFKLQEKDISEKWPYSNGKTLSSSGSRYPSLEDRLYRKALGLPIKS